MRKIVLLILLVTALNAGAQVKTMSQLTGMSMKNYADLSKSMSTVYWKKNEQGKMDTLSFTRWIPAKLNPSNIGEMVMCYYKPKTGKQDYVIYQTLSKKYYDDAIAELYKNNYKPGKLENNKDGTKQFFSNGKFVITVTTAKQKPSDPVMYVFGARPQDKTVPAAAIKK